MRLMLVIAELGTGGAESVVIDLAADAAARGDEVAVVAARGALDARLEGVMAAAPASRPAGGAAASHGGRPAAGGLTRLPLPAQSGGALRMPLTVAALRSALRTFRPDLIHAHNPRVTAALRVARALARMRGVPMLATYHGVSPERARNAGRVLRGAARIACVSEALRAELAAGGVPADKLVLVHNGTAAAPALDPGRRAALDAELGLGDGPVVSAVGRLVPQKNHARFLAAVARAAPELPDARFLVVGDGALRSDLEAQARSLDLGERLTLTGVRSDARDLIARSDLLVLSSDWEGLPLVALEGLAAGVPLLSTAVAGIEELTAAGAAESVPADSDALASGLVELLRDRDRLRAMGERARELHAGEFSVERMVGEYRRLYGELV